MMHCMILGSFSLVHHMNAIFRKRYLLLYTISRKIDNKNYNTAVI